MRNPVLVLAARARLWSKLQLGLALMLAAGLCMLILGRANPRLGTSPGNRTQSLHHQPGDPSDAAYAPQAEPDALIDEHELKQLQGQANLAATREESKKDLLRSSDAPLPPFSAASPLITHTAELAMATKEFSRSRTSLQEILERHRGYAAKLRMVGQKSGSVLSATLRMPSTELSGALSDLKTLGEVEREEQAADEITQQRADLEARLTNAQNALRRLKELLEKQTYPDGNVRELQRQIANASAEMARLEAERQNVEQRVLFANVYFTLREELAAPSESLGAQLRSALLSGFGEAMSSLAALLVFLIGRGPVVLLWCAILYVPVRWVWKRLAAQQTPAVQGA